MHFPRDDDAKHLATLPVGGPIVMINEHADLIYIMPDDQLIILDEVYRKAADFIKNGFRNRPELNLPAYIADWKKATELLEAVQGYKLGPFFVHMQSGAQQPNGESRVEEV